MPKEGFDAVTLPSSLTEDIEKFVEASNKLISGKAEALKIAWLWYKQHSLQPHNENRFKLKIGNKAIGDGEPSFVIADLSTNHNGDILHAKKLIDIAAEEGCDAVKFHKKTVDDVYSKEEMKKPMLSKFGTTFRAFATGVELGKDEFDEINEYCRQKGIIWFAECWDAESVDFMERYNLPCYELSHNKLKDEKLIQKLKSTGKPIIMTTGMLHDEVKKAVEVIGENNVAILHSTKEFPTQLDRLYLKDIQLLKRLFRSPIGYYGNEVGVATSVIAAVAGASIIERKITYDRSAGGAEHVASLEPNGLRIMVRDIKSIPLAMGEDPRRFPYKNR